MSEVELTISGSRPEANPFRLVATLVVVSVISGFVLSGVYQVTKPVIDAGKARLLRAAVFTVAPGSTQLRRFALRDGAIVPVEMGAVVVDPTVHAAYDEQGGFLGWAVAGDGPGFQDTIEVLYGYDPRTREVTGMHILASRETPGLGDKIFKDEVFVANFDGLALDPSIVVVKDGRDAANEVDAITGATISSRAVASIINEADADWRDVLDEIPPALEPEGP